MLLGIGKLYEVQEYPLEWNGMEAVRIPWFILLSLITDKSPIISKHNSSS